MVSFYEVEVVGKIQDTDRLSFLLSNGRVCFCPQLLKQVYVLCPEVSVSGAWPRASQRSTGTTVRLRDRYVGGPAASAAEEGDCRQRTRARSLTELWPQMEGRGEPGFVARS